MSHLTIFEIFTIMSDIQSYTLLKFNIELIIKNSN